jgi:hypothetical protein
MAQWLVRLQGQSADLQEFPDLFRSDALNVKEEGGDYYLRSSDFDVLSDSQEVRERASGLLPVMTGIVKLHSGYSEAVAQDAVIEVKDDGTRVEFKASEVKIRARAKLTIGERASDTAPTKGELWMSLSQQDDKVMDALRFFEEETTWWSLRKTYEAVESDFKQQESLLKKKLGLDSLDEIKRFKGWASYHVHGEQEGPPNENRHPPISLPEAESFIREILLRWGYWKQKNQ